jgi:hypothetical protein
MHNPIPHGTHKVPRYCCIFFFDLFWNLIRRFADNDEIHFDSPDGFIIILERFEIHATREPLEFSNGIQNVANTVLSASS